MLIETIKAKEFKTINWSGGTSTELFIYPPSSDYKQGNFEFRLSTATVEVEKSNFTSLPGVSRKLMILDGEIEITHENQYSKKLTKFDIDTFEGDWKTSSIGKCVDFNLMTRENSKGELSAISLTRNKEINYPIEGHIEHLILYALSGDIIMNINEEIHHLQKGNLLVIDQIKKLELLLTANENCNLILAKILKV